MKVISLVLLGCCLLLTGIQCQLQFSNPIFDRNSADPAVLRIDNFYYLTLSENLETELTIFKSPILTSFREDVAEKKIAYVAPQGYSDLWASEMHLINGELYIYFTMQGDGKDHRMYVIKADDPTDPMGNWSDATRLMPDWDLAAIDGTPFQHLDGNLYFVWASWAEGPLTLFIAPMENPTTVVEPRVFLRGPRSEWECQGGCVNEGAYFIFNKNVSYMVFSASSTWDPNYCLGVMSIHASKDPLVLDNWASYIEPVFSRNDEENVYTTGHASFTTSPDGTETWVVYHGTVNTTHINGFRVARIEKLDWNEDGSPRFPRPHGYGVMQPVPSGQTLV